MEEMPRTCMGERPGASMPSPGPAAPPCVLRPGSRLSYTLRGFSGASSHRQDPSRAQFPAVSSFWSGGRGGKPQASNHGPAFLVPSLHPHTVQELLHENRRHSRHSGNGKGFRSFVPVTKGRGQCTYIPLFPTPHPQLSWACHHCLHVII